MIEWFIKKVKEIINQGLILMINNFFHFLFDLFNFFNLLNKRKVILINLRRSLLYLYLWHLVLKFLIIINTCRIFFCLWLITNNTSLWYFWHKRSIRINLFLYLYLFNDNLLFNDRFCWYKVFICVIILYW